MVACCFLSKNTPICMFLTEDVMAEYISHKKMHLAEWMITPLLGL